jgi:hypothetical protein
MILSAATSSIAKRGANDRPLADDLSKSQFLSQKTTVRESAWGPKAEAMSKRTGMIAVVFVAASPVLSADNRAVRR